MYIETEKKNIGGLKYCEGCPYFKLEVMDNNLYSDGELHGVVVTCEHVDICFRIDLKSREGMTNDTKKNERRIRI